MIIAQVIYIFDASINFHDKKRRWGWLWRASEAYLHLILIEIEKKYLEQRMN